MNTDERQTNFASELEDAYKKLCILAGLYSHWMPDICNGVSLEDLPNQVILVFLESPNNLGWDSTRGPLVRFLLGVLKHKIKDHLRRQGRVAGSIDDPDFISKVPAQLLSQDMAGFLDSDFYEIIHSDLEFSDLAIAAENIQEGYNRNQRLAQELQTTTKDVVNRKRRLQKRLISWKPWQT